MPLLSIKDTGSLYDHLCFHAVDHASNCYNWRRYPRGSPLGRCLPIRYFWRLLVDDSLIAFLCLVRSLNTKYKLHLDTHRDVISSTLSRGKLGIFRVLSTKSRSYDDLHISTSDAAIETCRSKIHVMSWTEFVGISASSLASMKGEGRPGKSMYEVRMYFYFRYCLIAFRTGLGW